MLQARSQSSSHASESRQETSDSGPERTCSASQALIEMAVKTGLSLLFALLRQSWQQSAMPGIVSFMVTCFADAQTLQFISFISVLAALKPKLLVSCSLECRFIFSDFFLQYMMV
jgi:E3 ubiquitin-protein ligase HERC1